MAALQQARAAQQQIDNQIEAMKATKGNMPMQEGQTVGNGE